MGLYLYQVTEQGIITTDEITYEDIVLLLDDAKKHIYVWKGPYSRNLDEFSSKNLYESVLTRFLNPSIFMIKSLEITDADDEQIKKVKNYLSQNLPDLKKHRIAKKLKDLFLLRKVRRNIEKFNNYEKTNKWKSRLSNLTNLRKLSIFNVVSVMIVIITLVVKIIYDLASGQVSFIESGGVLNSAAWELWRTYLLILLVSVIIVLGVNFFINLAFILFPLRFPIDPLVMNALSTRDIDKLREKFFADSERIKETRPPTLPPAEFSVPHAKKKKATKASIDINIAKLPSKVKKPSTPEKKKSSKKMKITSEYQSNDDEALGIPSVPMKKVVKVDESALKGQPILEEDSKDPNVKTILVECKICGKPIKMPVPKRIIEESELPVTDVTYVHGDPPHAVTAQLDRDFAVRRRRCAEVIFQTDKNDKK